MNFKQFCEKVYEGITEFYGNDVTVELKEVEKNNGVILTGLLLSEDDCNVSPAIYLDSFFLDYKYGREMVHIIMDIVNLYEKIRKHQQVDIQFFMEYEAVKERICFKLINYDKNKILLRDVPHIKYLNLAIVFFYAYDNPILGTGAIMIRNIHQEEWKVTIEELYQKAKENTVRLFPPEVIGIEELLEEMVEGKIAASRENIKEQIKIPMYILTNNSRRFGAISIFYPEVLNKLAQKENANLFLLPCSVHEVILLPDRGLDAKTLKEMVQDVNETQVAEEEILSNSVYYFDRKMEKISVL
jgi:hypothetical protein